MALYTIISFVLLSFLGIYIRLTLKKSREKRLSIINKERERLALERERSALERERLAKDKERLANLIKEKTIELAIKAKEDDDKLRLLHKVREKIVDGEENPNVLHYRLKEIKRMLDEYLEIDNKTFEIQMDEIHQDFFKKMKSSYPNLSIYDLRLCAYLKIGLNSKEMSEILRVLPSSINVSRSRLRKKLELGHEVDLYSFLNSL
jgi:hypothetical protein